MKINNQYQSLHLQNNGDVIEFYSFLQELEKDICLFYYQQSDYSYIMSDLYYGNVYDKDYWNYLMLDGIEVGRRDFIDRGCLAIILAMLGEIIDGTGGYLHSFMEECRMKLEAFKTENKINEELFKIVLIALSYADERKDEDQNLTEKLSWVHKTIVRNYFIRIGEDFNNKDYFK